MTTLHDGTTTIDVDLDCDGFITSGNGCNSAETACDCDDADPSSYTTENDADCDGLLNPAEEARWKADEIARILAGGKLEE